MLTAKQGKPKRKPKTPKTGPNLPPKKKRNVGPALKKAAKQREPEVTDSEKAGSISCPVSVDGDEADASSSDSTVTHADLDESLESLAPVQILTTLQNKARPAARTGKTYLCNEQWRETSPVYGELFGQKRGRAKVFAEIGSNIFLDVPPSNNQARENVEGTLRMSLWYENALGKRQRCDSRYSVPFDFDALTLLKENLEPIEEALRLCDSDRFLGFSLNLSKLWYATVEHGDCSVSFRHWWRRTAAKTDPTTELLPSRDGLRLNYDQFKRLSTFLNDQLGAVFPHYKDHVFKCDRPDHVASSCDLCTPLGFLPLERQVNLIMHCTKYHDMQRSIY